MAKKIGFDDEYSRRNFLQKIILFFGASIADAFKRIFDYTGRTSRASFWTSFLIFGLSAIIAQACEIWAHGWNLGESRKATIVTFKVVKVFSIYMLLPLFVRRLHDRGLSVVSAFNPFNMKTNTFGIMSYLVEAGDTEDNKYGPPDTI